MVGKFFDDLILMNEPYIAGSIICSFHTTFTFRIDSTGHGNLHYFGVNIIRIYIDRDVLSVMVEVEHKPACIFTDGISRARPGEQLFTLTTVASKDFLPLK